MVGKYGRKSQNVLKKFENFLKFPLLTGPERKNDKRP
jgi:hypothetical protein